MEKKQWTNNQMDAISARDGTLLVSAAAGSGKTAVLVQRVIERITNVNNPCDVDKLLIVTFTNAAAAEMRERISQKISKMLIEDPYNAYLQRQQILLTHAHISTIHSFCNELVKENFYKLNISPEFRIADFNEMLLLRDEAIKVILDNLYDSGDISFFNLVESFSNGKNDDMLIRVINTLYDFISSHPFPKKWMEDKLNMYNPNVSIDKTEWGKTIIGYASSALDYCIDITKKSISMLSEDSKLEEAYKDTFLNDLAGLLGIKQAVDEVSWNSIRTRLLLFKFERLKSLRGYKEDPLKINVTNNRIQVKETISKLINLFSYDEDECLSDIQELKPIVEQLLNAVCMFSEKLDELKNDKNIADFGDLEHWALKLLVEDSNNGFIRTDEAVSISNKFEEVIVDEYQDTNEVQDIIFRAVSKDEKNLFVVGDVKQSIYRFRQAMPEIFLRRKEQYPKYDKRLNKYPAKVILDRNFRSREGVTNSINFIFRQLMSQDIGEMDYTSEEELVFGASFDKHDYADMEFNILDLSKSDVQDMDIAEARHISKIIFKMIGEGYKVKDGDSYRPVTYRDFCVLIRNANKHAAVYANELQLCGIPAWSDTSGSFFGTTEISVILSILKIIDNPVQDIPLISVLMSPIYGFSPDKLSDIRIVDRKMPLYFALKKMAGDGDEECSVFIKEMEKYRSMSTTVSSDALIQKIYDDTGYTSIVQAMQNGEQRLANLRMLLEYARVYESSGYKCVSGFIKFIEKLEQNRSDLSAANTVSESANVVKIMSIHRSKGLEFPICILANCARKFNKDNGEILLHPSLGLGIKIKDNERMLQYSTMPRESVAIEIEKGSVSEELRVLYVALTRAKEKMIILTSLKDPYKTICKLSSQLTISSTISSYTVRNASSFSDWLLLCALRHPSGAKLRDIAQTQSNVIVDESAIWDINFGISFEFECKENEYCNNSIIKYNNELLETFQSRFSFKYKDAELSKIPTKISVSELSSRKNNDITNINLKRPSFTMFQGITPAEKGTALHAFLQFADFVKARNNVKNELEYLIDKGFLSQQQGKVIDLVKAEKFLNSSLMDRILLSKEFIREYRFTIDIKSKELDSTLPKHLEDRAVVLQGSIDCLFIEDEEAVIIDYKTDKILSSENLLNKYRNQILLYKRAVEECLNLKVKECLIYSFGLNKEIKIL